ncbi:MAG: glycosyl hydrolase [Actinomycetota bacterium]
MSSDAERTDPDPLTRALSGLALRSIGPAFMGGRIADIAVHPTRPSTWYVAVGSGGVWKTTNAGTTWTPIFDCERSYSTGCIALDPSRPETVWVGTGEAVSGRHVAWGDGVYRSTDGGASWEHMGLAATEHIADILIDPRDGNVVHVAAEGPLWSSGGERGLFRTTDGGATWEATLTVDDDTGVTSAVFAPDDPNTIHAATYQRRRNVRAFMGSGPGSGIHTSTDGGSTWTKRTIGLPSGNLGKIGLAVTPAEPDLVYATIESPEPDDRGFYRSTNRGGSWERRNKYLSGGTGPHYYQELFASPTNPDKVYQVDVFLHVTIDGGATFKPAENGASKHSDNHVVWIDPANPDHLLVGCDGGLYETFDDCATFRLIENLPISQFYRVAVDDGVPFTTIMGGAQDLGTLRGPLRTAHVEGVRNQDWWVPLGSDGYQVAFDPNEPDISYLEWQVGNVMRHDMRTMELTDIQPSGDPGDPPERFNWDMPIVLSPHQAGRLYVASQRVWRSDDRGDSWTPISGDLTTGANRYELPVGDRVWSVDDGYDHMAMSWSATITSLSESPVAEGVLSVGTDDGLVHVSEDGGGAWRRAGELPGLPAEAFVNDVEASRHDANAVFVAADNHKNGDYTPYLFESVDRGASWRSIRGDLPDGVIIWQVEQDHENANLLFIGAENGLWVTLDRGDHWHRLGQGPDGSGKGGSVPTISMRDVALQRRDGDLVAASFGRGFYVLDDYSPLRHLTVEALAAPAALFPIRNAWRYVRHSLAQADGQPALGATAYTAPNPDFGAMITYHLSEDALSAKAERRKAERAADGDVEFPGHDRLLQEHLETDPAVRVVVRNGDGAVVRVIDAPSKAGLHRVAWDLRGPAPDPVDLTTTDFVYPWETDPQGRLLAAGTYSAEVAVVSTDGMAETLAGPESFDVVDVPGLPAGDEEFAERVEDLCRRVAGGVKQIDAVRDRLTHLRVALAAAAGADDALRTRLVEVHEQFEMIAVRLTGDPVGKALEEPIASTISGVVQRVGSFSRQRTGPPTATERSNVEWAATEFASVRLDLDAAAEALAELTRAIDDAGGTWTPR